MKWSLTLVASMALLTGCFEDISTPFPDAGADGGAGDGGPCPAQLAAWEENTAEYPAADGTDEFPETINYVETRWLRGARGMHARAYVHADITTTFEAVRNPMAGADRRESTTFTFEEDVEPSVRWSHQSHLSVPDIVTVDFDLRWLSDVCQGTVEAPVLTSTRWQKVFGSSAISLLEGNIQCVPITADVTGLEIQYHLDSLGADDNTIRNYLQGYYDSIVALAHGDPLPVQE
ncbi:MAG: hypothetical protein AB7S26_17255 [Sandaracinaceae bacterium]